MQVKLKLMRNDGKFCKQEQVRKLYYVNLFFLINLTMFTTLMKNRSVSEVSKKFKKKYIILN